MEEKRDLRIQKTYNALCSAFLALLNEKKFEEITVNELCDRALVGRGTFYKHFADKYEFFGFMVKEIYQDYTSQVAAQSDSRDPIAYYTNLIHAGLAFMEQNAGFVNSLESSNMFMLLQEIGSREVSEELVARLKMDEEAGYRFPADPELMAQLIQGALLQAVRWWLLHRDQISKESMQRQLSSLVELVYASAWKGKTGCVNAQPPTAKGSWTGGDR